MNSFIKSGKRYIEVLDQFEWLTPLVIRVVVGFVFLHSGWGKLHHVDKVADFFEKLGIPAARHQAPLVAVSEFVCGTLLLVGFLSRLVSLPLIATMAVAILTAKRGDISEINDLFGLTEFLYIVLLTVIVFRGPGPVSVDRTVGLE